LITKRLFSLALSGCLLVACGQNHSDKQADAALAERDLTPLKATHGTSAPVVPQAPAYSASETVDGGQLWAGVTAQVPAGWVSEKPASSMRLAQYAVPAAHGGESASLAVFAGNMGSVDDNIARWIGQLSQPDGSDSASKATRWEAESDGGLEATLVDVSGTYNAGMGSGGGPVENHRVLGAIVSTGSTFLYLKLTGPDIEVADLRNSFEQMIRSMRVG
jgi:hypothetical protein